MKILVFAPHSAIWVHAFPEALVAESLQQAGHEIVYTTCGRLFRELCVCMVAHGVRMDSPAEEKKRVCDVCDGNKQIIRKSFGFPGHDLMDLIEEADHRWVNDICASVTDRNLLDLVIDGVAVGRCALSHFLINQKKGNLEFTPAEWSRYRTELRNALYAFAGCRRLFDRERPDRVIVYVAAYSVNYVCCELARIRGIPHYYLAAAGNLSNRLQSLVVAKGHAMHFQKNNIKHWNDLKDLPCSSASISYVAGHFRVLLQGKNPFVYSSPARRKEAHDLRVHFGVGNGQRVLLAAMSSYDEMFASQIVGLWPSDFKTIFPTQADWIRALIDFVGQRKDLFLIIRLHPRELPNKREGVRSDSVQAYEELLAKLPSNARVNWPSDQLSIYDIAQITDVCLNAWSSTGKELPLFGIPVVTYAPELVAYAPELNYVGGTQEAYFQKIEQALANGWSADHVRAAFRWYVLEFEKAMIDLSDSYQGSENDAFRLHTRVLNRIRREIRPHYRQLGDCRKRAPVLGVKSLVNRLIEESRDTILDIRAEQGFERISIEEETAALKREIGRLIEIMYGSRGGARTGTLKSRLESFASAP